MKVGLCMARILVADDAIFIRMTIERILQAKDHKIVGEAVTGVETVEKFVELKPDVVILDISMPEMSGIDALKQILEIDPKAKVIICSALGQQQFVSQAMEIGAADYIVKPFEAARFVEALENALIK